MGARRGRAVGAAGLVLALVLAASGCLAVGEPDGFLENARAFDVNDHGLVVGSRWLTEPININDNAYSYDLSTGTVTDLGGLGGANAAARGVNNAGEIVGYAQLASGQPRAFHYAPGVGMTSLGVLAPAATSPASYANDINDDGIVVGWSNLETGAIDAQHAFRYDPATGVMTDLGTLGGANSQATAINDAGVVVGWSEVPGGARHAFAHDPATGVMSDLGTLGGTNSEATGINDLGQVVGSSETGTGDPCWDFSWGQISCPVTAGFVHDLGTGTTTSLPIPSGGDTHVVPDDINDAGVVLATAWDKSDVWCSHCSPPNRVIAYELGTTGVYPVHRTFTAGGALNDAGLAVGTETNFDEGFAPIPTAFRVTIEVSED